MLHRFPTLLALVLCCSVVASVQNECNLIGGEFYGIERVMNCLTLLPFNKTSAANTLEVLKANMQLYTFKDLAINSPEPHFPINTDLIGQLTEWQNKTFPGDFEFQRELSLLFMSLQDAHTMYHPPKCYESIGFLQPFKLLSLVNEGKQRVVVSPLSKMNDAAKAFFYPYIGHVEEYLGAEVLTIDDEPALQHIINFAATQVGVVKDPKVRFNLAMGSYMPSIQADTITPLHSESLFTKRNLWGFSNLPADIAVKYGVRLTNGTELNVTAPWMTSFLGNVNITGYDSWYKFCAGGIRSLLSQPNSADKNVTLQYSLLPATSPIRLTGVPEAENIRKALFSVNANEVKSVPPPSANDFRNVSVGKNSILYLLNDTKTAAWFIEDFSQDHPTILRDYIDVLEKLVQNNITNLILDFSGNGGGNICSGRLLMKFLFGEPDWMPSLMPSSDLSRQFAAVSPTLKDTTFWTPSNYYYVDGKPMNDSSDAWIVPGEMHRRQQLAGSKDYFFANFSKFVHINDTHCDLTGKDITNITQRFPIASSNIVILTNGFCGSTCSMFADHAAMYHGVKTYVKDGPLDHGQMQFSVFPGGQVMEWAELEHEYLVSGLNYTKPMMSFSFRLCARELHPKNATTSSIPLEFQFLPADKRIFTATAQEAIFPQFMWYRVLADGPFSQ